MSFKYKNFQRIGSAGFSHLVLLMLGVFLISVIGSATLIASHANPARRVHHVKRSVKKPHTKRVHRVKKKHTVKKAHSTRLAHSAQRIVRRPRFVYFSMDNRKWANKKYPYVRGQSGEGVISLTGCGPTSLAMVADTLNQNKSATPYSLALAYGSRYHYSSGTSAAVYPVFAHDFGLNTTSFGRDLSAAANYLASNGNSLVVANANAGIFTGSGHIVVFRNYRNGKFLVADGKHRDVNGHWYTTQQIEQGGNIILLTGFSK